MSAEYKKADLVKSIRELSRYNLEILSSGNISLRLANSFFAIKPSGLMYDEVTEDNISITDSEKKLTQGLKPSSDVDIHYAVYESNRDINCIVHTHSHYVTVMSSLARPLEVLTTLHADYFGKSIYCMPYKNHHDEDIGRSVVETGRDIVLMERHGGFIFAEKPEVAIRKAVVLEEVARLNYHIMLLNQEVGPLRDSEVLKLNEYYNSKYGNDPK